MKVNFYVGDTKSRGGSKVSLLNNILLLKEKSMPFNVYTNGKGWFTDALETNDIKYKIIKEPYLITKSSKKTSKYIMLLIGIISFPRLLHTWYKINKEIKKGSIVINEPRDVVLFLPILFKRKIKKILWLRGEKPGKLSSKIMRFSDLIVGVSDEVLKNVEDVTKKPKKRVYNFLNKSINENINKKSILNNKMINLAVVGTIQPIKGQLDALKVTKNLRNQNYNVNIYLVGKLVDLRYGEAIRTYIDYNNINENVVFTGQLNNVIEFMDENIDLLLVPSQTESFCRVAMEAMSIGVPVIAYKVGGLKEVISDDNTGYLIEKDNLISMTEKTKKIINDMKLYEKFSYNSVVNWNNKFSKNAVEKDLLEVFYGGKK